MKPPGPQRPAGPTADNADQSTPAFHPFQTPSRGIRIAALTDRLPLGTSLRVSPVCLGLTDVARTVPAAFDAGINFFFLSADLHWPLYENTRRGLRMLLARGGSIRDEITVAVASYCTQPDFSAVPYQEVIDSLPMLARMDVALAGGLYSATTHTRQDELLKHKRDRFLGTSAIGASYHDRAGALDAICSEWPDIVFVRYNPTFTGPRLDLFPKVASRNSLLYTFKSTSGYLSVDRLRALGIPRTYWHPRLTDHYRFALSAQAVDGILVALRTPAQVAALASATQLGPLTIDEQDHMMRLAMLAKGSATFSNSTK